MTQALTDILKHPEIWRVGQLPRRVKPSIPTGFPDFDRVLPARGWEQGAMTEILANDQGIGEMSLLAPALRQTTLAGRNVVIAGVPYVPFPHAWESLGISLNNVLLLRAEGAHLLWSLEQAARSASCAIIVAWTTACRKELTYQALRRLHRAAETGGATLILFRPENIIDQASPAPTRIALKSTLGKLHLRIFKRRGAMLAETIRINVFPDHWTSRTIHCDQTVIVKHRNHSQVFGATISSSNPQPHLQLLASR